MSGIQDISTTRRLQALAERLSDLERMVETLSQVPAAPAAPRDIWLGRTVAGGQTYPTSGNTFRVELIRGDYATTAGDTEVTEYRRGTIVTARTWPDAYIPAESQVIVMRIRGKEGPGEWWIETHSVDLSTMWAELVGGFSYDSSGVITGPSSGWSQELTGVGVGPASSEVGDGRLHIALSGKYHITAHADATLRWLSSYPQPDGYIAQRDNLTLSILINGFEAASAFSRIESDIADGRVTTHLSTRLAISAEDDPPQLWIAGSGGSWGVGHLSVWRWRLYAVRIGD